MSRNSDILAAIHPRYHAQIAAERARPRGTALPGAPAAGAVADGKPRIHQRDRKVSLLEERWGKQLRLLNPLDTIHEQFPLALGNGCNYYLDFLLIQSREIDGGRMYRFSGYEVKGPYARAAGIAKLKIAAAHYPWIEFELISEVQGRFVSEGVRR